MAIVLPEYPYRLDGPFTPSAYDIYLEILDLDPEWKTEASDEKKLLSKQVPVREEIFGRLNEATNEIVLNARGIKVTAAEAYLSYGVSIESEKITYDEENELVTLVFSKPLPEEEILLTLEFTSSFTSRDEAMDGLYQAVYKTADGDERIMATSQFEPMDARAMFLSVDQPDPKATFSLAVRIPVGETAVSNMPIAGEELLGDGTKIVEFEQTVDMSTYVLYIGVAQFEILELEKPSIVPMRAYTTPGNAEKARKMLEFGDQSLAKLQKWFGVPYPLPKCDFIGVPDFPWGAMEHWGAVTFLEAYLYIDEHTPIAKERYAYMVVAHELAHMWFGNLVTMRWWNGIWLNESFATFMAYLLLDELKPEWRMFEMYMVMETAEGMDLAELNAAHPIEVDVTTPMDIVQKLDAISYGMGGSVLRQLYAAIGHDPFMNGVRLYLERHQFGNATTSDLYAAWDEVSDVDVSGLMQDWTQQTGFPVLFVAKEAYGAAAVQQRRFRATGVDFDADPDQLWKIPVGITTPSGATGFYHIEDANQVILGLPDEGPVLLNREQAGFYIVRYDSEWLAELADAVSAGQFSSIERWGLQADMARLLFAGLVTVEDYLTVLGAYTAERNPQTWKVILKQTERLVSVFEQVGDPLAQELRTWALNLFASLNCELGLKASPQDDEDTQQLREYVLEGSCIFGDEETIAGAIALFDKAGDDLGQLDPNVVLPILQAVALNGDEATLERLTELYQSEKTPEAVRQKMLIALGYFRDESLLARAFDFCVSDNVRPQDRWRGWRWAPGHARRAAWDAYRRHRNMFDRMSKMASKFALEGALGNVPLRSRIEEAEAYFEANPAPDTSDAIAQMLESCEAAIAFTERNEDTLKALFDAETV